METKRLRFIKNLLLFGILSVAWLAFMGAKGGCGGPSPCDYNGKTYQTGESFSSTDGCNTCSCDQTGQVICTKKGCVTTCDDDGKTHKIGDTYPATDGCNTCTCQKDGSSSCTKKACPKRCETRGGIQCKGDEFCDYSNSGKLQCGEADAGGVCKPKPQGCTKEHKPVCGCDGKTYGNACMAHAAGSSIKSQGQCGGPQPTTCKYDEKTYKVGDTYPATDGCNTCTCQKDGSSSCTEKTCPKPQTCGGMRPSGSPTCKSDEFCDLSNSGKLQCGEADRGGICKPKPTKCDSADKPVCGCDGKTYTNECVAHSKGASVRSQGKCATTPPQKSCKDDCDCASAGLLCDSGRNVCAALRRLSQCPACGASDCKPGARCYDSKKGSIGTCPSSQACGTRGGIVCSKGQYCDFSNPGKYQCGETDLGGSCQTIPQGCTKEYKPVCGCDGKTYGNACMAHASGVSVKSQGKCATTPPKSCKDDCDCAASGLLCDGSRNVCAALKRLSQCPVCGASDCKPGVRCYNSKMGRIGICPSTKACGTRGGITCSKLQYCDFSNPGKYQCGETDLGGSCKTKPQSCTQQYAPVCGCNGKTYGNSCSAASAGVSVKYKGKCQTTGRSCIYNNKKYAHKTGWTATDGCNLCSCNNGVVTCTKRACPPKSCTYNGKTYAHKTGWAAADGCNLCSCNNGAVTCTKRICPPISCKSDCDCVKIGKVCHLGVCAPLKRANLCPRCGSSCTPGAACYNGTSVGVCSVACKSDCDCIKYGRVCYLNVCAALKRANLCPACGSKACTPKAPCYDVKGNINFCGP